MTSSRVEALRVVAYGNSFLHWPDRWSYLHRLERRYGWQVSDRAVGGERAADAAARAIAGSPSGRYVHGEADLVIVDTAVNDFMGGGMSGLLGFRNALRALLAWVSLEGVIEDARSDVITYAGGWSTSTGGEWSNGTQRSMTSLDATASMPAYRRPGKWAFGYYGLAAGMGMGGEFRVSADGVERGRFSTHAQGLVSPVPTPVSASRNWTCAAAIVDQPTPADRFTIARAPGEAGGGPYFDWYGKVDEATAPLVVCPTPTRYAAAGYALSGIASDEVVAAYRQAIYDVAAEIGSHVYVVDVDPGWEPQTMLLPDRMHPNPRGSAHLADRIGDTLDVLDW